jgi:uncharacterized protein YeaO (DUF488 family)
MHRNVKKIKTFEKSGNQCKEIILPMEIQNGHDIIIERLWGRGIM